jgi:demethylmenaquinone methyltransferase / 2-methoxy-6-polyprenyl-1,4-benzoquinol methylase
MFDGIAGRYDLVNSFLSLGTDRRWRRAAARACALTPGASALDVACGTGRLTEELARGGGAQGRVVGLDFSSRMLQEARRRRPDLEWVEGDALSLPFPRDSFEAATIAFGLRNLAQPDLGLAEMARVVQPGGRLVVLEFLRPSRGPLGAAYRLYLTRVLPSVGGWLSGDRPAYRYLSETVDSYLGSEELIALAVSAGWREPRLLRLNLGTVALLLGRA